MFSPIVSARELEHWADSYDAAGRLPCLIRRLVWATDPSVKRLEFRCEEGVRLSGWDGFVYSERGSAFVPDGLSVWEISTAGDVARKASLDYEKRKENTLGVDPRETTYVFVALRRWPSKQEWVLARKGEGFWQDVRVYDADDLAAWIEQAPAVNVWLASLLGRPVEGVWPLEDFWDEWAGITEPRLSLKLLLAGRGEAAQKLKAWLKGNPQSLSLQADSREEALAFLRAVMEELPRGLREARLSQSLIIEKPQAWGFYREFPSPLLLIPVFPEREGVGKAMDNGHHVYIPLGRDEAYGKEPLSLPRIARPEARDALIEMGIPEERAWELAGLARRNLLALRRVLASDPGVRWPKWARVGEDLERFEALLPLLLVGTWQEDNEHDQRIVAEISGIAYEDLRNRLLLLSKEPDPPVRLVGQYWIVASREDLWRLLGGYLTKGHLVRFQDTALEVLGEQDPAYDLSPSERIIAPLQGMVPKHSKVIKEGIAHSLALMGALAESSEVKLADCTDLQDFVDSVVRRLFGSEKAADWKFWASLAAVLPMLAEASPDVFLGSIEKVLKSDSPILHSMFQDQDSFWGTLSPHTGLLWALEVLAWSPDYLPRVTLILGRLTSVDPGGQPGNRPADSLKRIFTPWLPQTGADLEERISALGLLRHREPGVAWRLLLSLLPSGHDVQFPTAKPKYRFWGERQQGGVSSREYWSFVSRVSDWLIGMALGGSNPQKWAELVGRVDSLDRDAVERLVDTLKAEAPGVSDQARALLVGALREVLARHLPHRDQDWSLPDELLDRLLDLYEIVQPRDPILRHGWLFEAWPRLIKENPYDLDWQDKELARQRGIAISEIHSALGLDGILELANRAATARAVGHTFATRIEPGVGEEDSLLGATLGSEDPKLREFASGFVTARFQAEGWDWVEKKLRNTAGEWNPRQKANFYLSLPLTDELRSYLSSESDAVHAEFWSQFRTYGHGSLKGELMEWAAGELIKHGRPYAAIGLLGTYFNPNKTFMHIEIVIEALETALNTEPNEAIDWSYTSYTVGELLNYLEAAGVSRDKLAWLEWAYLPLLGTSFSSRGYGSRGPKVLHEELSRDPGLFVEMLTWVFKAHPEGENEEEVLDEKRGLRAEHAFRVLKSWRRVPGLQEDGGVDPAQLRRWIKRARLLAKEKRRLRIADELIGEVLAYAPAGSDGAWPHEAVREIIEEVTSEDLERGIEIGVYNKRGVVSKSVYEGGEKEREIAEQYRVYAKQVRARWPRTAAVLRRIAEHYDQDARREDLRSNADQDLE